MSFDHNNGLWTALEQQSAADYLLGQLEKQQSDQSDRLRPKQQLSHSLAEHLRLQNEWQEQEQLRKTFLRQAMLEWEMEHAAERRRQIVALQTQLKVEHEEVQLLKQKHREAAERRRTVELQRQNNSQKRTATSQRLSLLQELSIEGGVPSEGSNCGSCMDALCVSEPSDVQKEVSAPKPLTTDQVKLDTKVTDLFSLLWG